MIWLDISKNMLEIAQLKHSNNTITSSTKTVVSIDDQNRNTARR